MSDALIELASGGLAGVLLAVVVIVAVKRFVRWRHGK